MVSPTAEAAVGGGLQKSSSTKPSQVQQLVSKARAAQAAFEAFSQEQVDAIVRDFGKYVYDNAESIAADAHNETGLGTYEDKVAKAKGKARVIWNNLKGKRSRGIIGEDEEAKPDLRGQAHGRGRGCVPGYQSHRHAHVQCDVRPEGGERGHLRPA